MRGSKENEDRRSCSQVVLARTSLRGCPAKLYPNLARPLSNFGGSVEAPPHTDGIRTRIGSVAADFCRCRGDLQSHEGAGVVWLQTKEMVAFKDSSAWRVPSFCSPSLNRDIVPHLERFKMQSSASSIASTGLWYAQYSLAAGEADYHLYLQVLSSSSRSRLGDITWHSHAFNASGCSSRGSQRQEWKRRMGLSSACGLPQ